MDAAGDDPVTVLHVDDEPEFAEVAATCLEREAEEFEVVTEHGAEDGLDRLASADVDCVVSDYRMPGTNGMEFLEAVREREPDLPFILFTGQGSEAVASRAISAGVTDYLQKESGTDQYAVLANRIRNAVARRRAERRVEQGFQALATAREGVSLLDEDGRFTYANDAFCEVVGYDREELLGEHWELLYPEEDVDRVYEELLPSIPAEGRWTGETVYVRKDGERILVDHALSFCETGATICLITELSGAGDGGERARAGPLVAEDAFVEAVLEALDDVFWVLDRDGVVVRTNEAGIEATGRDGDELLSTAAGDLIAAGDRDRFEETVERALREGRAATEADLLASEHGGVPYSFRLRRVDGADGEPTGVVVLGRNRSERLRRERRLERQAEQFELFGRTISHDFRTPLSTLAGRIGLARETGDLEHLEAAATALERLDALVEDLGDVMREGNLTSEIGAVELAERCRSCWDALDAEAASLVIEDAPEVRADGHALARLLENLFRNAVQHGGPDVTVRVGSVQGGFYVADDGPGIPEEHRDDIFDPGYSTAEDGTGFGTVSVRQIALAHGWDVAVTESEDGGARFEFTGVESA